MQILGEQIVDPHEMEHVGSIKGLGLLAIHTTMQSQKITRISSGHLASSALFGQPVKALHIRGYEIHIGETRYLEGSKPFAQLETGTIGESLPDGCISANGRVFGSYLHGLFDDDNFRHAAISAAREFYGLAQAAHFDNWKHRREESLDRLADTVRASLDMSKLFGLIGLTYNADARCDKERSL
jgi:adenosylcobyric acid synthase